MYSLNEATDTIDIETYSKSQDNVRRLKAGLQEGQVADFAQEVIRRIAAKYSALETVPHEPSQKEIETLCDALISDDDGAAADIIVGVRAAGASPEDVYLKHLAAAARMLGEWWKLDQASFAEVTIGTSRLYAIMRSMRHLFMKPLGTGEKFSIFASVPGETHTLGVRMAADLFRKDGWDVDLKLGMDHDDLVADIENSSGGVIGLSTGGSHSIEALTRLVAALQISCPHLPILVSGQDIEAIRPTLALMGVDGIAADIEEAKEQMTMLCDHGNAHLSSIHACMRSG